MAVHHSLLPGPRTTSALQDPGAEPLLKVDLHKSFEYVIPKGVRGLVVYKRSGYINEGIIHGREEDLQHVLFLKPGVALTLCELCVFKGALLHMRSQRFTVSPKS